jgi:hypothetical protein
MICQACGVEAPTNYVAFYRNIGLLVIRFSNTMEGHLCKSCVHKYFWQYTSITFLLGWWGIISFIVTIFFLPNNIIRYLFCLGMEPVPFNAVSPTLGDAEIDRLQPHTEQLFDRLNRGDELQRVLEDIAMQAQVTPGQVALYVHALVEASKQHD